MERAPTLSVTVLNYNYGGFIGECLDSILSQTFTDFELIVLDDHSTDDSLTKIKPYLADPRVKLVAHEVNQGFQASLIEGTEVHSRGKYLTVISADDLVIRREAFEEQLHAFEDENVVLSFTSFTQLSEDGNTLDRHAASCSKVMSPNTTFKSFLLNNLFWALHSGTIFSRDAYWAAGAYRRDITMPLDLALWMKLSLQGSTAYLRVVSYAYRMHSGQMSNSRLARHAGEVATIVRDACADGEEAGLRTRRLERKAIGIHLGGTIMQDAFGLSRKQALGRIIACTSVSPVAVLTSKYPWIALLRLALGANNFDHLRRLLRSKDRPRDLSPWS